MLRNSRRDISIFPRPVTLLKWSIYLTIPAVLWVAMNYQALRTYFTAQTNRNKNRAEVHQLEKEYAKLADEKKQLETGGFLAEKAVRELHIMVRPGEKVIFIETDKDDKKEPKKDLLSDEAATAIGIEKDAKPTRIDIPPKTELEAARGHIE